MAAKIRQQTIPEDISSDPDIIAMEDEQNFSSAKEAVMTTLNVKHPVSYDQYNICSARDPWSKTTPCGNSNLVC